MYILSCNSFNVCYGKAEEILTAGVLNSDAKYIIAQTHFRRTDEIAFMTGVYVWRSPQTARKSIVQNAEAAPMIFLCARRKRSPMRCWSWP